MEPLRGLFNDQVRRVTADWALVPYDLLGKISNRVINEINGVNRAVCDISHGPGR